MNTVRVSLTINGLPTGPHEVPETLPMIDYLHEYCGLTGHQVWLWDRRVPRLRDHPGQC